MSVRRTLDDAMTYRRLPHTTVTVVGVVDGDDGDADTNLLSPKPRPESRAVALAARIHARWIRFVARIAHRRVRKID